MKFRENTRLSLFDWIRKKTDELHTWKAKDGLFSEADQATYECIKDHPIGIRDFKMTTQATTIQNVQISDPNVHRGKVEKLYKHGLSINGGFKPWI